MKRMLLSGTAILMASAAFASPAQASGDTTGVVCNGGPITECVPLDFVAPCKPLTECARGIVNRVIDVANGAGPIIIQVCQAVFPTCKVP